MLDADEIRWVKSTANELNNLLQVITESSQFLEKACEPSPETQKYFDMLHNGVERAAQVAKMMLVHAGEFERGVHGPKVFDVAPASEPAKPPPGGAEGDLGGPDVKIMNPNGPKEIIMIVDDEAFVTMLAQRVLIDDGYRVITARDGFECLDIYKRLKDKISLVILDFTMPIMDGSEVFDQLRLINPRACVVLSSGFTEQEKLRAMLAKGLRGFIPKPYTQQKLLLQIRTTLDAFKSEK